jgi:hypothetical protein
VAEAIHLAVIDRDLRIVQVMPVEHPSTHFQCKARRL